MEAVQISRQFFFLNLFLSFFSIGLNFTSPPVVVVGGGGVDVASRGLRLLLGATTTGVAAGGVRGGGAVTHHLTSLVCMYVWTHACVCVQYSPRRCRRAAPLSR